MNETIEITRGDVLTTVEMSMRGIIVTHTDRGGVELRTKSSTNTVADWLVANGFIDDHQQRLASVFMDLRRAYDASMGTKWVANKDQPIESLLKSGEATELYDAIRREIGLKNAGRVYEIISYAMLTPTRSVDEAEANICRSAFDALTLAMKNVRESKKDNVSSL